MPRKKLVSDEKILEALETGHNLKTIASRLGISYWTVIARLKSLNIRTKRRGRLKPERFSTYNQQSCYWAGFLAADEWISSDWYYVGLELAAKYRKQVENLKSFLCSDADIWERSKDDHDSVRIQFNSKALALNLSNQFNLTPAKSLTLQPPIQMPHGFRSHFIRGYFDGDGCISWHKHNAKPRVSFASGSRSFLEWIQSTMSEEIESLGSPSIRKRKNASTHMLSFMGKQTRGIYKWMYADSASGSRLARKHQMFSEHVARF